MAKSKEEIMELCRKLFNLGDTTRGATIHEAEAAMDRAKKLMAEYNLSMSDIEVEDLKADVGAAGGEQDAIVKKGFKAWEVFLLHAMMDLFNVGSYTHRGNYGKTHKTARFYGSIIDVALAVETYKVLHKTAQLSAKYLKSTAERNSWRLGFAKALKERAAREAELDAAQQIKCNALMVVKQQIVTAMEAKMHLRPGKPMRHQRVHGDAYDAGYSKGKQTSMKFKRALT